MVVKYSKNCRLHKQVFGRRYSAGHFKRYIGLSASERPEFCFEQQGAVLPATASNGMVLRFRIWASVTLHAWPSAQKPPRPSGSRTLGTPSSPEIKPCGQSFSFCVTPRGAGLHFYAGRDSCAVLPKDAQPNSGLLVPLFLRTSRTRAGVPCSEPIAVPHEYVVQAMRDLAPALPAYRGRASVAGSQCRPFRSLFQKFERCGHVQACLGWSVPKR